MGYFNKIYTYRKETVDFNVLCSEYDPPQHGEKIEVTMELDIGGFPFYRLKFVDREGHQYFDLARPLLKYYVDQGFLEEYTPGIPLDEHKGMVYNPIDGNWRWL